MASSDDAIRLTAVNHLTYNVTDKERALRFWEAVLGVKQIPKQVDIEHLIWLQLPSGTMVHLIENTEGPSKPQHHAAFEVDDIEATIKSVEAKGGRIQREEGNSNVAWVHPLGTKMVFVELQQRGSGNMGAASGS